MLVQSVLVQGAGDALASKLAGFTSPVQALVLFSLGASHSTMIDTVRKNQALAACNSVYLAETYGIIGYDEDLEQNMELMEKGRGTEYGFVGGSGGEGCLVVGFSEGCVAGHTDDFPREASSCMVIADQTGEWQKIESKAPLQYGGISKECYKVSDDVPYFWVADTSGEPTGVSTFTEDAADAVSSFLKQIPANRKPTGQVGLFPCYTRGFNLYQAENVESSAIGTVLEQPHVYGMFAHGELGPVEYAGFPSEPNTIACKKHSMTSILSIHTCADDSSLN